MATLISRVTGNFTSSSTWEQVDSTSELDSNASTVTVSTSNIDSAAFTPGAITITGIALKINARVASPTGTMTVTLRNSSAGSDVTSVTVNVADLPYYASSSLGHGWVFFKFSSSQLLLAATNYLVRVVCSNSNQVTLWRNGTSNNVCRLLATTTTAAPASGDKLIITGERTGSGAGSSFTVTLDNTATTSFGPTVSGGPPEGIVISQGGTLACGTSASTAYYLKWKGIMHVCSGGLLQVGTSGTPIPSTSSCTLYCDSVSNVDTGLVCDSGGTVTIQGAAKNHATTLTANAASSATVLTLGSTSGWAINDVLGLGPGDTARTGYQTSTVSTVDSATQVTLSAGISAAKRGSAPHFTEVINLTRNVIIRGVSSSLRGYFSFRELCTVTMRYFSYEFMGAGFTTIGKMGVDLQPHSTGTVTVEYGAFQEGYNNVPHVMSHNNSKTGTVSFKFNVSYKNGNSWFYSSSKDFASLVVTDNVCIGGVDGATPIFINTCPRTASDFSRNVVSGSPNNNGNGIEFVPALQLGVHDVTGWFDDCRLSYCGGSGLQIRSSNQNITVGVIANLQAYMNASRGVRIFADDAIILEFTAPVLWGNGQFGGIYMSSQSQAATYKEITVKDGTFNGSTWASQDYGILMEDRYCKVRCENCSFGSSLNSGFRSTHATADIGGNQTYAFYDLTTIDCVFASTTEVTGILSGTGRIYEIKHQRYDGTDGDNRYEWKRRGGSWAGRRDTTIFNTASPSEKISPSMSVTAYGKARSASRLVNVSSAVARTISVSVRKSAVGDGAAYTGNQPRLIMKANPAIGFDSDTVLDTMTAAVGSWEQLSASTGSPTADGVVELYVDCDGAAGFINVDDWSVS